MAHQATPSSQKALMMELKSLQEQPVEGFRITLVEESDLYNWEVAIFGPPNTLYEGGYFKVGHNFLIPRGQGHYEFRIVKNKVF